MYLFFAIWMAIVPIPRYSVAEPLRTVHWTAAQTLGTVIPARHPVRSETLRIINRTSRARAYRLALFDAPPVKEKDWVIIARARCQGRGDGCVLQAESHMGGKTLRKQADVITHASYLGAADAWSRLGISFFDPNARPARIDVTAVVPARSVLEIGPIQLFEGAYPANYPEGAAD